MANGTQPRSKKADRPNVRFGSKADICSAKRHVRFTPNSGHWPDRRLNSSGQDFIKILRGGSGFYKNCSRPERPPPLVEPPFEGFNFAFEPNRLDLLYFALNLETIYDVALSAEFGKLARALLFEFFNPDLKLAS